MSDEENNTSSNASPHNVMVQKLVRLALSSEYARLPIRRADISAKVLLEQGARQFKPVFAGAQQELRSKFGMEMTELPAREKVTISQRRGEYDLPTQHRLGQGYGGHNLPRERVNPTRHDTM